LSAHDAYQRLNRLLRQEEAQIGEQDATALPAPAGHLRAKGLAVDAPSGQPILRNVAFDIQPGDMVGVTGANGAGKSTLGKAMVGAVRPRAGYVRLDGVDVARWHAEDRGQHIGYLPQDIELFDGTIAENIARFQETAASDAVVAAARRAGVDGTIRALPEQYDTHISESGGALTPGQRQRIGLARALYGAPTLLVFDEANASLDDAGEQDLMAALRALAEAGHTVVMISHSTRLLRQMDKLLIMKGGTVSKFASVSELAPEAAVGGGAGGLGNTTSRDRDAVGG
jgi:ABC-type protease/lipase transport system fused ATPase/permease subunit